MNKYSAILLENDKYSINKNQVFKFDVKKAKQLFKNIKFPVIILDTEFFNSSHDKENQKIKYYESIEKNIVYVLQYSLASSIKEIYNRDNSTSIKSMTIRRNHNDFTYDFEKQYHRLILSFLNMCVNKKIKTIICSGGANDIVIINKWLEKYRYIFSRRKIRLVSLEKPKEVNSFDVHSILENCYSFSNMDKDGSEFWPQKNLPKGKLDNQMITLTSMKKFFDWFGSKLPIKTKKEDEEIYNLCCKAVKFYSIPNFDNISATDFDKLSKSIKKVIKHCYNDVYKILEFLSVTYHLMNV